MSKASRRTARRKNRSKWRAEKRGRRAERMASGERLDKGPFEVYVTAKGKCYHPFWCVSVNGVWLDGSTSLRVMAIDEAEAGGYEMCPHCDLGKIVGAK